MLKLGLGDGGHRLRNVLCLGAHCDDIEIGCGGTILRLAEEQSGITVRWIVFSSNPKRESEARASAAKFLEKVQSRSVEIKVFRNGFFPYVGAEIKEYFEQIKDDISPDIIFTHYRNDLHQDHRTISQLTWNTFRDHFILEYEIAKYDGDLGSPNFFVPLTKELCRRKIDYIMEYFATQRDKQWFTADTFNALMRLRGVEANAPDKHAEAFYCRKAIL